MKYNWYELTDPKNGEPICYLSNHTYLKHLQDTILKNSKITKLKTEPNHLEFIVEDDGQITGSFESEDIAIKYNVEGLNTKGEIIPHPKK